MARLPTLFVGAVVLGLVGACPHKPSPPLPSLSPEPVEEPAPPDDELPPPQAEPPPPDPGPCPHGRLWDGKPVDCSYEHGGCCYDSAAHACEAAGCEPEKCTVLESYPAQIRCG